MLKLLKKTWSANSPDWRDGHMWGRKRISNGFGLQLTPQHEKLSVYIGDRSSQSAKQLWQSLPSVYRAVCYTDFEAYEQVLPSKGIKQ